MKKILMLLAIAACAVSAHAASSYSYWLSLHNTANNLPTGTQSSGLESHYQVYSLSVSDLEKAGYTGATSASDANASAIATWLNANFSVNYGKIKNNGSQGAVSDSLSKKLGSETSGANYLRTRLGGSTATYSSLSNAKAENYWTFLFYGAEDATYDDQFRVYSTGDSSTTTYAADSSNRIGINQPGFKSGWVTVADVPEPTSGLLLLIGVAGLALKRRRA